MADPKGPETGQAGGHNARPKPATLDLSATEVSKPAGESAKPANTKPAGAGTFEAKTSDAKTSDAKTDQPKAAEPIKPAVDPRKGPDGATEAAKPTGMGATGMGATAASAPKPDATSAQKPATTVPPSGAKADTKSPDSKASDAIAGGPRANGRPADANGATRSVQPARSRSGPGYGSVVAAALAGAALAVLAIVVFGKDFLPAPTNDVDDSRIAAAEARLDAMSGDLATLGNRPPPAPQPAAGAKLDEIGQAVAATGGRVDAVEARMKEIGDKLAEPSVDPEAVATLAGRIDGVDVRLRDVATTDAVTALQARVAGAEAKADAAATAQQIAAIEARVAGVDATVAQAVEPLDKRVSALDSALKARPVGDPVARQVVALGALEQALDAGRPFPAEFAAVKASASDNAELAALEPYAASGAPTRAALSAELATILAGLPAEKPAEGASVFSRFVANAGGIVKVTPKDGPGDAAGDPRSRLAALAASGDVEQALAARESLDEAAKAATADWATHASARILADKALAGARAAALSRLAAID